MMRRLLPLLLVSCLWILPSTYLSAIIDINENGLSDVWERTYNNNALFSSTFDPQADPDGDGWTNAVEAAAGTDPFNANPPAGFIVPEITHYPAVYDDPDEDGIPDHRVTPEAVTITWPTVPGKLYTLLTSPDLEGSTWMQFDAARIGDGNVMGNGITLTQPNGSTADRMFWRISITDTCTDGDTLTDAEEYQVDTDPHLADTDGDGLSDSYEIQIGSSPFFKDTDGDGISDSDEVAAGTNPAGDDDGDGKPDHPIYSVEFEVQEEWHSLDTTIGFLALSGTDDTKEYFTQVRSEEYTITGSSRYTDIAAGLHKNTFTWLVNGTLAADGSPVSSDEGIYCSDWQSSHPLALTPGESLHLDTTVTSGGTVVITATERYSTLTYTTPWQVRVNSNDIRSGTEVITITDRTKLSDAKTYPELWALFKPWNWQPPAPQISGPLEISKTTLPLYQSRESAAESARNSYKNSNFPVSGVVSLAGGRGSSYDYCLGARLKSMRWRWVRFDPLHPFARVHAAPPASSAFHKQFNFSVTRNDTSGVWSSPGTVLTQSGPDITGIVTIDCDAASGGAGWHDVPLAKFDPFKQEDPTGLTALDYSKWTLSDVHIGNSPVFMEKRIPDIADDGGATTYSYQTINSVPRETPLPGVEITAKDIADDHITLTAKIYDALSDVVDSGTTSAPKLWVNSREYQPAAGDKPGVYRLQGHVYQLYPGRNEITVAVENALGGRGSETIVVEGDNGQGYQIAGEPVRTPLHPTYPVLLEIQPGSITLPDDQSVTLTMGNHSETLEQGTDNDDIPADWFRSKPFLSVLKPASGTSAQVAALPAGKPIFLSELEDNLAVRIESSEWTAPAELTVFQSGVELTSPKTVEIQETGSLTSSVQIKTRGLGASPSIKADLTTYKDDEAIQDITDAFTSAYQTAYGALAANAKNDPLTITVNSFELKEGYNGLSFDFANSRYVRHGGTYQSFRFPAPTKAGVRVFSANRKTDSVLEGVTGRMGDTWYPVAADASLSDLADALITSGCQVVGMTDVNGCFDDTPLKRPFLVRGPPGRTFQAFDQLYAAQGRDQRSQTFEADGTHGAALADELDRVQTDQDLPASAKNALGLEIAKTYQFHNGFEDFVPKTHQAYVDPGNGVQQPNSWTMRGSSLPDHLQSNPAPWVVTNTLSDPSHAASAAGIVRIDTTAENTAYYATTSATAPWNLTGARAVSLRFKLLSHDPANGPDGAFQLAAGDGTRTWTCQVAPTQVRIQGSVVALPVAKFPNGLIDGKLHTLQFNFSGTGNDALVSIDGEVLTATATAQSGTLNGIAFGDPGAGIAGKFETEALGFENSDLKFQYGIYGADDYADSDEIDGANNILLYLRSKGLPFRTSPIAQWVKILDPKVYEWLLGKYTGKQWDGVQQELNIFTDNDVWLGSTVDVAADETYGGFLWMKKTKVTNTINIDKEETKVWSTDQTRNDMQFAGFLMAWTYQQDAYKIWLAEQEGGGTGIDGMLIENKLLVDNIAKCAKRVETTIEVGGEIAISMTNEYADYAITIKSMSQGDYMAMVGFIPLLPSSTARVFKFLKKEDGAVIEAIHQLSTKLDDFPGGKHEIPNVNLPGNKRVLDFEKIFANAEDVEAVARARHLTSGDLIPNSGWTGTKLLDTFSNSNVSVFKTKQPVKAYRCFSSNPNISEFGASGGFLMFEKPVHRTQVEVDYALGKKTEGFFLKNQDGTSAYDRYVEVEIPEGVYVYMGYAADQGGKFKGGGTQLWVDDIVRNEQIDWNVTWNELPQN